MERSSHSKKRQEHAGRGKGILLGDRKHLQLKHCSFPLLPFVLLIYQTPPSTVGVSFPLQCTSFPPHIHLRGSGACRQAHSKKDLEYFIVRGILISRLRTHSFLQLLLEGRRRCPLLICPLPPSHPKPTASGTPAENN